MATNPSEAGVETTSPSILERRNSLEKHLQHRPDEQDLKDRHILLDTTAAPALQARQQELERQRITDNLKKGLSHRSDKETLIAKNILPESTAAPAIQAQQKELEHHMRADSLEKALKDRPTQEQLVKDGILKGQSSFA
ncbi:Myocardin-related transcription factor B [Pseudocercospora fuligena]|uniref:Myocardin-related transcription factor B n=1 Tax=Pseudocercospora fuligena TaxID=685502 RepID=A0A8H6R9E1_9PEZI|nr:Myocardin-related transcription factor B [Pseudocercospora fuligena]